jgi:hypothetical protein
MKMNTQKLIISTIVGTIVYFGVSYIWYELLMSNYFTASPTMRDPINFPLIIVGSLIFLAVFCYIYPKGVSSNNKVSEGAKFGVIISLLTTVPMALIRYATVDVAPFSEYLVDAIFGIVLLAVVGIVVAFVSGIPGDMDRGPGDKGAGD